MGVLKFRLPQLDRQRAERLKRAYIVGPDRSPFPMQVEIKGDTLICRREATESGRLHVPWVVPGYGEPVIGTSTLAERPEPYDLALELARGRLCDVRDQLSDWTQMGLRLNDGLHQVLGKAQSAFAKAATRRDQRAEMNAAAEVCLVNALEAGHLLIEQYVGQVLQTRLSGAPGKLPTALACGLEPDLKSKAAVIAETFNAGRVRCGWKALEAAEGNVRWDTLDAQLAFAKKAKLAVHGGPLIDLSDDLLPDWLSLWRGDFDTILGMAGDFVRSVLGRYRGKVPVWTLVNRAGSSDALGLSEEDQIRLTARMLQIARQTDPGAQYLVGFDRPWSEWMTSGRFQLGPLHLADYLARSDLGLSGVELEIAPGYSSPGSLYRDIFDFSRLLDLYALVNLPLSIHFAFPSSATPDSNAAAGIRVEASDWPEPPSDATQFKMASQWISLAVAKPYVRSVAWMQVSDEQPHLYPHSGLFGPDGRPKSLLGWLGSFRRDLLG